MRENFSKALAVTLKWEGGFVSHPADPGGATNKGVTLKTYRRYNKRASVADLKRIPQSMVERIYRDGYWNKVGGDRLAPGVDLATFDYGVNSGPGAARKSLLKVAGGPDYRTVQKLCRRRLSIYRTFRHWSTFGRGWTHRVNAIEAKGVRWAKDGGTGVLVNEAGKADKISKSQGAGAAGGGGGAGGLAMQSMSGLPLTIVLIAIAAMIVFALWRANANRQRAEAYRNELKAEE